jgi:uncharacterized protein (TIGR00290 family)
MSATLRSPKPLALFWSTGKDSALALHELKYDLNFNVVLLILTIQQSTKRVSMHGVPAELAVHQASATGIPIYIMEVPDSSKNVEYEKEIEKLKKYLLLQNIRHVAFGDIFLEDLRRYRENLFCSDGFELVFPLWKKNTSQLLERFIKNKFKAVVVCCNAAIFPKEFCGTTLDENFTAQLPENIDPCGENGEFHTFCFEAPVFKNKIFFYSGNIYQKNYYNNCIPTSAFYFLELRTYNS